MRSVQINCGGKITTGEMLKKFDPPERKLATTGARRVLSLAPERGTRHRSHAP